MKSESSYQEAADTLSKTRNDDRDLSWLVNEAIDGGATRAKVIFAKDVFVDKRVRLKCAVPVCSSYGAHLMCPPNLMSIEEVERILSSYRRALLIQIESKYNSADRSAKKNLCKDLDEEITEPYEDMRRLHAVVNRVEASAFKGGFRFAAGLIGGECTLCDECVSPKSGLPCRHPFEARPSMEAMGIDVVRTCEKAGMKISLSSDKPVRWTGIVLLD